MLQYVLKRLSFDGFGGSSLSSGASGSTSGILSSSDMFQSVWLAAIHARRHCVLVINRSRGCQFLRDVPVYGGNPATDSGVPALRDRNHASITWDSLCNELGYGSETLITDDTAGSYIKPLCF